MSVPEFKVGQRVYFTESRSGCAASIRGGVVEDVIEAAKRLATGDWELALRSAGILYLGPSGNWGMYKVHIAEGE